MPQIKQAIIKAYTTANVEDTNYVVTLLPATGTNNNQRVDIIIERLTPPAMLQVSLNYNELMTALGVVK